MITAVVDSNALASGFASHGQVSAVVQMMDAWRARSYILIISEHILSEVAQTFEDPYFRRRLTQEEITADLHLLRRQALLTSITVEVHGVATHPEDDLVLSTAVSAHTDYLVTGDTKLRRLKSYEGVAIVSPREFLEILQREQKASE